MIRNLQQQISTNTSYALNNSRLMLLSNNMEKRCFDGTLLKEGGVIVKKLLMYWS